MFHFKIVSTVESGGSGFVQSTGALLVKAKHDTMVVQEDEGFFVLMRGTAGGKG